VTPHAVSSIVGDRAIAYFAVGPSQCDWPDRKGSSGPLTSATWRAGWCNNGIRRSKRPVRS